MYIYVYVGIAAYKYIRMCICTCNSMQYFFCEYACISKFGMKRVAARLRRRRVSLTPNLYQMKRHRERYEKFLVKYRMHSACVSSSACWPSISIDCSLEAPQRRGSVRVYSSIPRDGLPLH